MQRSPISRIIILHNKVKFNRVRIILQWNTVVRFVTLVFLINYSILNAFTKTNEYFFPSELIYFVETSSNAEVMNEEMEERYFRVYQNANTGSSIF